MNFALILFLLSVISGVLWCYDKFSAQKKRAPGDPDPWWVEYGASFFWVILPVFMVRSFWIEPFRIPSGSMLPTLLVGDFILVNKYAYGIRLPVLNKKVIDIGQPQRGDVMVFRYPLDPSQDYIKRVIGVPGDKIEYIDKHLTVNGISIPVQANGSFIDTQDYSVLDQFEENLGGKVHSILNNKNVGPDQPRAQLNYPSRDNCTYTINGVSCTVPPGHYFMMGDNRDNSADSRAWGFVPEENIVGKAFFIWLHADSIFPPQNIGFSRVGGFN